MSARTHRGLALAAGAALAAVAPFAAPSSSLLPSPEGAAEGGLGALVLFAAFTAGVLAPRRSLYALVVIAVLEGGVRRWFVNDISVFLVKDFLALGIYAAVLPRLRLDEWRRSPWVVVPLAGLGVLALAYSLRSESASQALVGLRAYGVYVPLLWAAPKLLDTPRRVHTFLLLLLGLGLAESLLAILQALTGNTWLNEPVSGALPTIAVTDGVAWVRPTGTMLQTGTLAAFFVLPTLVALALVMRYRRGPLLALALVSLAVLSWGVLYTGSRAVWATLAIAAATLLVYLLWNRRLRALAAVPLSIAAGYLLIAYQPLLGSEGSQTPRTVTYRVPAGAGVDTVTIELGSAQRGPAEGAGEVIHAEGAGPWRRVREQLDELAAQGIAGHGTGRQTLGSQYVEPVENQAVESEYVRVAHELGLPALVLFVVFLTAVWTAAAWASFIAYEWRRPAAVVALGAATLVPILSALTFAFDYPAVAIAYYTLSGCALAWAARQSVPAPTPIAHASPRAATSTAPTPAHP